jgi:hypothetical protein
MKCNYPRSRKIELLHSAAVLQIWRRPKMRIPQSVTQATRSPHRLVRAAVLGQLENVRMPQQSQKHQSAVVPGVIASPE